MSNEEAIIGVLRGIAGKSKLAAAAFYMFALRKRSRSSITVRRLMLSMKKEGFIFSRTDYVEFIKLLGDLHIGTVEMNSRGTVKGLNRIVFTLQSVGRAAVGKVDHLAVAPKRSQGKTTKQVEIPFRPGLTTSLNKPKIALKILVLINGRDWVLEVPKDYTEEDVAKIICLLNNH